jgi:hypothetical protein
MYFDSRPKTRKEDLFNREAELQRFNDSLSYASLIVVTGLRRTGKTSFIDVALACSENPYIMLDMRDLPTVPARAEIIRKVDEAFRKIDKKWKTSIIEAIKHVKGVSVAGASVSFDWGKKALDLGTLLDEIDGWAKKNNQTFLLALDEIQFVRGDKYLPRLLARVADTNRNTITVITGSEIGLLYDFLGFDNPESPLYGRHFVEIKMSSFTPEQAKEFLKDGFKQINLECSDDLANYAVKQLDGIAGWLTLFGLKSRDAKMCSNQVVDETLDTGGKLSRSEALRIVKHSRRYGLILNFLAQNEEASWSKIKHELELNEIRKLPNPTVTDLLNRLIKTSLVSKEEGKYRLADPLLVHGLKKEPFGEAS